jgi:hypothetical protein
VVGGDDAFFGDFMTSDLHWVVHPHGKLTELAENLWTVEGTIKMPTGPLSRRMTVARLGTGELVIFSAIAVDETAMSALEKLGHPTFLVVPNAFHREDAPGWKARYPRIRVVTPAGARAAVEQVVPVDTTTDPFGDPRVRLVPVPGTGDVESALVVGSNSGTTLVINDIIGNVQNARGLMRPVLSMMGFAGRKPQVPRMFVARVVKDKAAVAGQFRQWAAIPDLKRIVVSHGATIEHDPKGVLLGLAEGLK